MRTQDQSGHGSRATGARGRHASGRRLSIKWRSRLRRRFLESRWNTGHRRNA